MTLLAAQVRKATQRRAMYEAALWTCYKCHEVCPERMDALPGQKFLTLDHIIPRCKGGPSASWNLVVMCDQCNHDKGSAHDISAWGGKPPWQYFAWRAQQEGRSILRRHNSKVRGEQAPRAA